MSGEAWQVVLVVLGIVGTIFGAYSVRIKTQAETEKTKALAEAEESKSRARQAELDAQAKLIEVQSEAAQAAKILDMMEKQIVINRQNRRAVQNQRKSAEEGYRVIRGVQNDTNIQLTNLTNTIKDLQKEVAKMGDAQQKAIIAEIASLKEHVTEKTASGMRELGQSMGNEIGIVIARQMVLQSLSHEFLPWPATDDPAWEDVSMRAIKDGVVLHNSPHYQDEVKVKGPRGVVHSTPHNARVIRGRLPGWWMVQKEKNGDPAGFGYVPERMVEIVEKLVMEPA